MKELKDLFGFFNVYDLSAFVHSGLSIDPVGHFCLTTVFINVKLRGFESVMGTPLTRA